MLIFIYLALFFRNFAKLYVIVDIVHLFWKDRTGSTIPVLYGWTLTLRRNETQRVLLIYKRKLTDRHGVVCPWVNALKVTEHGDTS